MMPPVSTPLSTAARIEPGLADRVERPDVVLVAVLDAAALGQVDAEATCRRATDSMSWVASALPAKSTSTKPAFDQRDHRRRGAGVHDARAADPQHLLAGGLGLAHAVGDLAHQHRLRLLAGDVGLHEAERAARPWSITGTSTRMPEAPHDDLHAGLHVGHRQRVDAQASPSPSTTRPQSISGFSTSYPAAARGAPGSARLVVE